MTTFACYICHKEVDSADVQRDGFFLHCQGCSIDHRRLGLERQIAELERKLVDTPAHEAERAYVEEFLDSKRIALNFEWCNPTIADELARHGYRTARDVLRGGIEAVYGIGPKRLAQLRDWSTALRDEIRQRAARRQDECMQAFQRRLGDQINTLKAEIQGLRKGQVA